MSVDYNEIKCTYFFFLIEKKRVWFHKLKKKYCSSSTSSQTECVFRELYTHLQSIIYSAFSNNNVKTNESCVAIQ